MSSFNSKLNSQLVAPGGGLLPASAGESVAVTSDNGIYFPQTAAEWEALGLTAPGSLWTFQESSGNIIDQIGSNDLDTITGTWAYETALTGAFSRNGLANTSGANQDACQRETPSSPDFSIAAGESVAMLVYWETTTNNASASQAIAALDLGTGFSTRLYAGNERMQLKIDGQNEIGATPTDYTETSDMHAMLIVVNRVSGFTGCYTDLETFEETVDPGALTLVNMGLGDISTAAACVKGTFALMAAWHDVAFDESLLETLGWSLPY